MNDNQIFDSHYQQSLFNLISPTAIEAGEFNLVSILKPSIKIDGDQWVVLYGENIQDGVAGYGKSPYLAVQDFNKALYEKLPK